MAIEQMKYISVLGPLDMFDEFVLKHVINRNVQLEHAYKSLNVPGLIPFEEDTSLDNLRKRMRILNEKFGIQIQQYDEQTIEKELLDPLDHRAIESFVEELESTLSNHRNQTAQYKSEIQGKEHILTQIFPIEGLDINIDEMFHFSFMKFRFGFLPKENYRKQKDYLDELDVVVVPVSESGETMWLSYFMPESIAPVIDNVFQHWDLKGLESPTRLKVSQNRPLRD